MRSALYLFILLVLVGVASCTTLPNPDAVINTPVLTPSISTATSVVVAAPTIALPTATVGSIRTPRPVTPTKTPAPAPTLVVEGETVPLPDNAIETKNIPAEVKDFAATQFKGLTRLESPRAYRVPASADALPPSLIGQLTAQGWDEVPMQSGLPGGISAIIAQKGTVRATYVIYAEQENSTLVYVILTRR